MAQSKPKKPPMPLWRIEQLSRRNAEKIVEGNDNLKSWGHSGWYKFKSVGLWMAYRSTLELRTYKVLDESRVVTDIASEKLIIPYNYKGANLNYVPDLLVKTIAGKVHLIEVKPKSQVGDEKNIAKWERAREWCFAQGIKFHVVTEEDIEFAADTVMEIKRDESKKPV